MKQLFNSILVAAVISGSFALKALAGNDDVRVSGSNTITDTKTGTVETTGTNAAAVSGTTGEVKGGASSGK
jgi:hypothetical protein